MEQLKKIFCRYDMVCDNPTGVGFEIHTMPEFFDEKHGMETDSAHLHGFYEIIWFREGEGVHYVDFNEYPVSPGTVFFISPGQVHSFDSRHDQKGIVMKICSELLTDELQGDDGIYLRYNVFNAFDHIPYVRVSGDDTDRFSSIVNAMLSELKENGSIGQKEYLRSLIRIFIISILRCNNLKEAPVLNPVRPSHKAFLAFRRLLEENYRSVHTVKEYASMLHVTGKTLTQYVNECSPYTPLELINNRILLEAKRMLRYSLLPIKEIAFNLGFEDPSYFVKFFKRMAGKSPADYREKL